MNRTPSYLESTYAIHQRYEDTSLVIFHQIQKSKPLPGQKSGSLGVSSGPIKPPALAEGGEPVGVAPVASGTPVSLSPDSQAGSKSKKKKKSKLGIL